jgi:hypothetical protein
LQESSYPNILPAFQTCVEEAGLDFGPIDKCYDSGNGEVRGAAFLAY